MSESENVLVLGHGTRAFLAVARSLGRMGLRVHVAMCPPSDIALRSKYIVQRHEVRVEFWLQDMLELLQKIKFTLVLPCGDESMHPVQIHQDVLRQYAPVYAYDEELYRIAFSKFESSRLANELGISVPQQYELEEGTTVDDVLSELSLPLVLKPPSSIDAHGSQKRLEVVRVRTEAELNTRLGEFVGFGAGSVAQENFIGIGVGVEVLAERGEVKVAFQHQRVHEPVEGGGSSYRRSAPLNPDLLGATRGLMRALNYSGVAMVEYKLNTVTHEWVFIEINGRFWGSLPLAIAAGVDFPSYLYKSIKGMPIDYPSSYDEHIFSRSLLDDYHWFANNLRADHSDSTQATVPIRDVLAELGNVFRGAERIDTWSWGDMGPAFAELREFLLRLGSKAWETSLKAVTPPFVAKRRAKRLTECFNKATSVGFVCYGNICRSPFAEKIAATSYSDKTFWSSGFHGVEGRGTPHIGVRVAEEMGVDLASWCSSQLTESMIADVDQIFVFDQKNLRMMQDLHPESMHKVFLLADSLGSKLREIEDPYSGGEREFGLAYKLIRSAVLALDGKA